MRRLLLILLLICSCAAQADAQTESPARSYFTDVELVDQKGETLRLYTDLLQGKVVVINVFFASCHGVCPAMAGTLKTIQDAMGERMGKQVHIISITVDPSADTPVRLKEFADKFQAGPGWRFVTGKKENVELALKKLGQYVEVKENHSNILLIGNEPTGLWKKAFGLAKAPDLLKIVESVVNDKQPAQTKQ
jgi:protein SCO1/2